MYGGTARWSCDNKAEQFSFRLLLVSSRERMLQYYRDCIKHI